MIFGHDRQQLRKFFQTTWHKSQMNVSEPLTALEQQVAEVIQEHPEYHTIINETLALEAEWFPEQGETNPFLHMGMHLAIREQLSIDQPKGIRDITRALLKKTPDPHEVEHLIIDCLGETIWRSQHDEAEPDMQNYLHCLKQI